MRFGLVLHLLALLVMGSPLLVRYLKSQGVHPEFPRLLVAAVFFKDRSYFTV